MQVPRQNVLVYPCPSVGTVITFSYSLNSRLELPSKPKITRTRDDLDWLDIFTNHCQEKLLLVGKVGKRRGWWQVVVHGLN